MTTSTTFGNFEDEISYTTVATVQNVGDVILLDGGIGVVHGGPLPTTAAGVLVSLRVRGSVIGLPKISACSWAIGAELFWDPNNSGLANYPTLYPAGIALSAQNVGDLVANVYLSGRGRGGQIAAIQAPVTGITGSTEVVAATLTIPAGLLIAGDILEINARVIAAGVNATDTFTGRLRVGGLAGTIIAATSAVNPTVGDGGYLRARLLVVSVGASGVLSGSGESAHSSTLGKVISSAVSSLNTTAAISVVVTGQWSSASASDLESLVEFDIQRLGG